VSPKHIGPHNKNRKPPKLRQTLPACRSQFEPCCPSRWVHGNGGFYSTFETTSAKQMIQFHGTLPPSPPYFNPWGHQPSFMGTEVHRANGASSPRKKTDSPISPGSQSSPDHIFEPLGPPPFVHGNGGVRSPSRRPQIKIHVMTANPGLVTHPTQFLYPTPPHLSFMGAAYNCHTHQIKIYIMTANPGNPSTPLLCSYSRLAPTAHSWVPPSHSTDACLP